MRVHGFCSIWSWRQAASQAHSLVQKALGAVCGSWEDAQVCTTEAGVQVYLQGPQEPWGTLELPCSLKPTAPLEVLLLR